MSPIKKLSGIRGELTKQSFVNMLIKFSMINVNSMALFNIIVELYETQMNHAFPNITRDVPEKALDLSWSYAEYWSKTVGSRREDTTATEINTMVKQNIELLNLRAKIINYMNDKNSTSRIDPLVENFILRDVCLGYTLLAELSILEPLVPSNTYRGLRKKIIEAEKSIDFSHSGQEYYDIVSLNNMCGCYEDIINILLHLKKTIYDK